MKQFPLCIILSFCFSGVSAQQKEYPDDVKSVDGMISALYAFISGDPGQSRDWARFRNLFKPETKLIPTRKNESGELVIRALSPEEYIEVFSTRVMK